MALEKDRSITDVNLSTTLDASVATMNSRVESQSCLIKHAPREVGLHAGWLLHDRDSSLYLLFVHDVPGITGINAHLPDHSARSAYESIEHLPNTGPVLV